MKAAQDIYKQMIDSEDLLAACELAVQNIERAALVRVRLPRNIRSVGTTQDNFRDDCFGFALPEDLAPFLLLLAKADKLTLLQIATDWEFTTSFSGRELKILVMKVIFVSRIISMDNYDDIVRVLPKL